MNKSGKPIPGLTMKKLTKSGIKGEITIQKLKDNNGDVVNKYANTFENLDVMDKYFEKQISQNWQKKKQTT